MHRCRRQGARRTDRATRVKTRPAYPSRRRRVPSRARVGRLGRRRLSRSSYRRERGLATRAGALFGRTAAESEVTPTSSRRISVRVDPARGIVVRALTRHAADATPRRSEARPRCGRRQGATPSRPSKTRVTRGRVVRTPARDEGGAIPRSSERPARRPEARRTRAQVLGSEGVCRFRKFFSRKRGGVRSTGES